MAAKADGSGRVYRSDLREQQAARTRETVVLAARELFESEGFAATTIAAIARRAGVSVQTVYAGFGNKAGIVRAVLGQMEASADAERWREQIAAATEPPAILEAFARWTSAFYTAGKPSLGLAQDAAAELKDLAAQGDAHRRQALTALMARLQEMQALRDGLTEMRAVDQSWLLTGLPTYLGATQACGWSAEDYADWLATTLIEQILEPARR